MSAMQTELVMKQGRIMTILASDSVVNIVYIFICEKRRVWQPSSQDRIYKPLTVACSWVLLLMMFIKNLIKRLLLQVIQSFKYKASFQTTPSFKTSKAQDFTALARTALPYDSKAWIIRAAPRS